MLYYGIMAKRYTQVPLSYLTPIFEEWRATYDKGDLVNVFFMPKGDVLFRAMQFVDWMKEKKHEKVRLINFEIEMIVNPENLREILERVKNEKLVLLARREFMRPDGGKMVAVLEEWYAKYAMGAIILHEGFPAELDQYFRAPVLMQKRMIHSLYPAVTIKEYAREMARYFGVKVSEEWIHEVTTYCGGIPWLINDVLRRSEESSLFEDQAFHWKVVQIAGSLPHIEGVDGELKQMGLKDVTGRWIPVLEDYFNQVQKEQLNIGHEGVVYNGKDYTLLFSAGERRILLKLKNDKGVIRREGLGEAFWGEKSQSEYSDWALDAIMSRLRKKLGKLNLPIEIQTRRGRGYELS